MLGGDGVKVRKRLRGLILGLGIFLFISIATYSIDYSLVKKDKKPIFVVKIATYKDGGTKEYYGFGYQVIGWNRINIDGIEFGYEIFRFPNFRNVNDGPVKELKLIK